MEQKIFTKQMAEEIAEEFRNTDNIAIGYLVEVPDGYITVDITSHEQYETGDETGRWAVGASVTFENARYWDDEAGEEIEVPMECEEVEFEYDDTDIDDWWPRRPW